MPKKHLDDAFKRVLNGVRVEKILHKLRSYQGLAFVILLAFLTTLSAIVVSHPEVRKFLLRIRAVHAPTPTATLSLMTPISTPVAGQDFTVPIFLDTGGKNIRGVDLVITFEPNFLTLKDVAADAQTTTTLKTFAPIDTSNNFDKARVICEANGVTATNCTPTKPGGTIEFGAVTFDYSLNSGQGGVTAPFSTPQGSPVLLATLSFNAKQAGTTRILIAYTPGTTTDSNVVDDPPRATDPALQEAPTDILGSVVNLDPLNINTPPAQTTNINLRVKFAGIPFTGATPPQTIQASRVVVQDTIATGGSHAFKKTYGSNICNITDNEAVVTFNLVDATNGSYEGTVPNLQVITGVIYEILVKGPSHLQTKVKTALRFTSAQIGTTVAVDSTATPIKGGDVLIQGPPTADGQDCKLTLEDLTAITFLFDKPKASTLGKVLRDINQDGFITLEDVTLVSFNFVRPTVCDEGWTLVPPGTCQLQ